MGKHIIINAKPAYLRRSDCIVSSSSFQFVHMQPEPVPPPCYGGILLCSWPIAAVLGMLVQTFITAWRVDHRRRTRRRHGPPGAGGGGGGMLGQRSRSNTRPRETREEARQRKYRYLYQVRTARGDIISQVSPGKG